MRWLLALVVAAAYAPSLGNGFVYDDHEVILEQRPLRSAQELARVFAEPHGLPLSGLPYYRPLVRASILVQKTIHGDRAAPFHAGNVLLAVLAALGAYTILRRPCFDLAPAPAALAAAAFLVHPVASSCVHPVASGRETLLAGALALAAVASHLRGGAAGRAGAIALFALALLGKEQALMLPLVFALADALRLTPGPEGRRWRAAAAQQAGAVGVVAGYLALRAAILPAVPGGALLAGVAQRPSGPLESLAYAIQVVFAPSLDEVYEPDFATWLVPARLGLGLALAGALLVAAARLPARDRAPALFWIAWFGIWMVPTANWARQETFFAERFVWLSLLGPAALAATFAARAARTRTLLAAGALLLVVLAGFTLHRARFYRDGVAFAQQWVRTRPDHYNARYSLGTALAREGRLEEALPELRLAVRLEPEHGYARYNLGVVLAHLGQSHEAMEQFEQALRIDPGDADAREALRVLHERAGR
jgi:tetratricopeptide (TPR) repeat protein